MVSRARSFEVEGSRVEVFQQKISLVPEFDRVTPWCTQAAASERASNAELFKLETFKLKLSSWTCCFELKASSSSDSQTFVESSKGLLQIRSRLAAEIKSLTVR